MVMSSEPLTSSSSDVKVRDDTLPVWPVRVRITTNVSEEVLGSLIHILTVVSSLPVARYISDGLEHDLHTSSVCD